MDIAQALAALTSGIGAANGVVDFFKGASALRGAHSEAVAAVQEQAREAKEALYTAKDQMFVLKDQIAELVDRIKELEVQLARRDEHVLQQIGPGAFAYTPKDVHDAVKNGPWLCQACFDDGKQSVFQISDMNFGFDEYQCPRCKSVIRAPNERKMEVFTAGRSNRFDGFL